MFDTLTDSFKNAIGKIRFHDDEKALKKALGELKKSLLIMHSPQDRIVSIKNAEELYIAARHPKSFISLDGSQHLLANKEDAAYAGNVIASWASRYLDIPKKEVPESEADVVAGLEAEDGFTTQMKAGNHTFLADEPIKAGGKDYGPTPYQFLSSGLASCTSIGWSQQVNSPSPALVQRASVPHF